MDSSIQDYAKIINRKLTITDCVSVFGTFLVLLGFLVFLVTKEVDASVPVIYIEGTKEESIPSRAQIFASKKGKTYTFNWCSGSKNISAKNKIFFQNEEDAKRSGRTLSKLCNK